MRRFKLWSNVTFGYAPPVGPALALPYKHKVGLDDFELIKVLGKGAFGKVWKVRRKGHAEFYAMKVCGVCLAPKERASSYT